MNKELQRLSLADRIEVLMVPLRQALKFYFIHFIPLMLFCLLYTLPYYLIPLGVSWVFPELMREALEPQALSLLLLVLLLCLPFQQAALTFVMSAKGSGQAHTPWETVVATFWVGVLYWPQLVVANLIRMLLVAAWLLGAHVLMTGLVQDKDLAQALVTLTGFLGALYLISRLAYFDFLIVLEQHTGLSALKTSVQLTSPHSGKLVIHLFTLSLVSLVAWNYVTQTFGQPFLEILALMLLLMFIGLGQAICFSYFWNTRHASSLNSLRPGLNQKH